MKKRIIREIWTSVSYNGINRKFYEALKVLAKDLGAKIKIIATKSFYDNASEDLINELKPFIVTKDESPSKGLRVLSLALPEKGDPTPSFKTTKQCLILGAPTQRFKPVPRLHKENPSPVWIQCTGSLNDVPAARETVKDLIIAKQHAIGAVVVETSNGRSHMQSVVYNGVNGFQYKQFAYTAKGKFFLRAEGLFCGDIHGVNHDEQAVRAMIKIAKKLKVKIIYLQDLFDAVSISHHVENNIAAKVRINMTLKEELKRTAKLVERIQRETGAKIRILKSNHDEHLDRYLSEPIRWAKDVPNIKEAALLFSAMLSGNDPLEVGLKWFSPLKNVKFYSREDVDHCEGFPVTNHGDGKINGGGSTLNMGTEEHLQGHGHGPETTMNKAHMTGCLLGIAADYCNSSGLTSWIHAVTPIYKAARGQKLGTRSLIMIDQGEWCA